MFVGYISTALVAVFLSFACLGYVFLGIIGRVKEAVFAEKPPIYAEYKAQNYEYSILCQAEIQEINNEIQQYPHENRALDIVTNDFLVKNRTHSALSLRAPPVA